MRHEGLVPPAAARWRCPWGVPAAPCRRPRAPGFQPREAVGPPRRQAALHLHLQRQVAQRGQHARAAPAAGQRAAQLVQGDVQVFKRGQRPGGDVWQRGGEIYAGACPKDEPAAWRRGGRRGGRVAGVERRTRGALDGASLLLVASKACRRAAAGPVVKQRWLVAARQPSPAQPSPAQPSPLTAAAWATLEAQPIPTAAPCPAAARPERLQLLQALQLRQVGQRGRRRGAAPANRRRCRPVHVGEAQAHDAPLVVAPHKFPRVAVVQRVAGQPATPGLQHRRRHMALR